MFTLAIIFLRFSDIHEVFATLTGLNTYVLYFLGPIALLALMASGRLPRVYRESSARFWLAFTAWMLLAVPFSSWRGGSFVLALSYLKSNFILLPVTAGLATGWTDIRKIMYTIAGAAVFDMGLAYSSLKPGEERLAVEWSGTIGNSNDLAAHLLLVLSFLLFVVLKPGTRLVFRIIFSAAIAFGVFQVLRTASRGALTALILTVLFVFIRGSVRQRVVVSVAALAVLILISFLSAATWTRLTSFSKSKSASDEALESSDARQYLLKQSIIYTFKKPLFGVGPGQFAIYEGSTMTKQALHGEWHGTHNTFTQVSSECGLPAFVFYLGALISTFVLLAKIPQNAVGPRKKEIRAAAYCITIGLVAFTVATFFINFAYQFHLPAISGLVIAMWLVVRHDLAQNARRQPPADIETTPAGIVAAT